MKNSTQKLPWLEIARKRVLYLEEDLVRHERFIMFVLTTLGALSFIAILFALGNHKW